MQTLYRINGLIKKFGPRTILDISNLTIKSGQLHILTGANGAGKSSLLSVLSFLDAPTKGELKFCGETVRWGGASLNRLRREVTLVHQIPYMFEGSVANNVAFGLNVRGIGRQEQKARVAEALERTSLTGFGERNAQELSGGEIRRVAIARALALKPSVLLLDEPLANVDPTTTDLLEKLIVSLPKQGATVIMTTHEADHADRLGGHEIHLINGKLSQPGTQAALAGMQPYSCPLPAKPLFSYLQA